MEDKKIKNKKILNILLYFVFVILMNVSFFTKLLKDNNPNKKWIVIYWVLSTFVTILIGGLVYLINKKKTLKPEKVFVVCAIFLELTYMFATPLFKGHDEQYQWYRDYEISMGKLSTVKFDEFTGNYLPADVVNIYAYDGLFQDITYSKALATWRYSIQTRNNKELKELVAVDTSPTLSYSPLQVLPQSIGVFVARRLGFDIYSQAMIGRLFNVMFFIIMGYFIIKVMPNKKYLFMAILFSPKILYLSSTLSSDNIINMTVMLFLANILKLRHEGEPLKLKNYLFFACTLPVIAMSKFVYIPVCGLLLLIPKQCFKNGKRKVAFLGGATLLALASFLWWKVVGKVSFSGSQPYMAEQLTYCMHHPIAYLGILIRSVCDNFSYWALDTVGGYMQWGRDLVQPEIVSVLVYGVMFLALIQDEEDNNFKVWEKIWIVLIVLARSAGIITAMYTACVPDIGATYIDGVQGKYFVPILGLMFLLIPIKNIKFKNKFDEKYIVISMLLFQVPSLLNIFVANIK